MGELEDKQVRMKIRELSYRQEQERRMKQSHSHKLRAALAAFSFAVVGMGIILSHPDNKWNIFLGTVFLFFGAIISLYEYHAKE